MTSRAMADEIAALPVEARREVMNFILFLQRRNIVRKAKSPAKSVPLMCEPFLGMWADRKDMADEEGWVRQCRQREWTG